MFPNEKSADYKSAQPPPTHNLPPSQHHTSPVGVRGERKIREQTDLAHKSRSRMFCFRGIWNKRREKLEEGGPRGVGTGEGGLFNLLAIKECGGERTTRAGRQQRFDFSIISCAGDSVIVTRARRYNQTGPAPYVRSRAGKLILSTQPWLWGSTVHFLNNGFVCRRPYVLYN